MFPARSRHDPGTSPGTISSLPLAATCECFHALIYNPVTPPEVAIGHGQPGAGAAYWRGKLQPGQHSHSPDRLETKQQDRAENALGEGVAMAGRSGVCAVSNSWTGIERKE